MSLSDLVDAPTTSPFSEDDRRMHTEKVVARTFGVEAAQLGTIEMDGDRAVLVIQHNGDRRVLRWRRSSRGDIQWYADEDERPLALSGGGNVLLRLRQALDD